MTDEILKGAELVTAVIGLTTAVLELFHAGQGSESPAIDNLSRETRQELTKRRRRAIVRFALVLICFLVISGIVLYSWTSNHFLYASLESHDPLVFKGQQEYPLARVYPDRGTLQSEGKLYEILDNTKDMQATNAHDFLVNFSDHVKEAMKRGVRVRILLFDIRDPKNCEALAATLRKSCNYLAETYNDSLDRISDIHRAIPSGSGSIELRLYPTVPLRSVWIKDRGSDDVLVQVEFHDLEDARRCSMRMGRLGGQLPQYLTGQFDGLWDGQTANVVELSQIGRFKAQPGNN